MENGGRFCPNEECEDNRGGYCEKSSGLPLGFASAALFMPGPMNFMAPFGPAMGMLPNSTMAEGEPPMTDGWAMWKNCPKRKEDDLKK